MQIKTIQKTIEKKLNQWLITITDDILRKDIKDNLLVSGGSITSMLMNEPVNDYDVYLMDIDVVKRTAEYYTKNNELVVIFDGREKDRLNKEYEEQFLICCIT